MQALTINGQEYAVKFSYSVILDFCEKQGIELYEYGEQMAKINFDKPTAQSAKLTALLIHCAILRGCEINHITCDLSVNDIIDSIFTEEGLLANAVQAIVNDMPVKKKAKDQEAMQG
jgi:hypothetical protein